MNKKTLTDFFPNPFTQRIAADILYSLYFLTEDKHPDGMVPYNVLHCRVTSEIVTVDQFFWYLNLLRNERFIDFCSTRWENDTANTIAVRFSVNGYKFVRGEI